MTLPSIKQIQQAREVIDQFEDRAFGIAKEIHKLHTGRRPNYNGEIFDFDGETIEVSVEYSSCNCCGTETYTYVFPTRYLYEDTFLEEEEAKLNKKKEAELNEKQEKLRRAPLEQAELDRKNYEKLKKRFETKTKPKWEDYGTLDYCARCGESPESATHLSACDYLPPGFGE